MEKKLFSIEVSSSIGRVSAELLQNKDSICVLTLAHGAGAGMNHPFMTALAQELGSFGISTLRFNFPFAENKKGRPDVPAVAHRTIEAAIQSAHHSLPSVPLFAGGKSFGGRMTSQWLSSQPNSLVKGIVFYGFPLHQPGKQSSERADHLTNLTVPMLFLQGTRDQMAEMSLMEEVVARVKHSTLLKIEGADHGFKAGKRNVVGELATHTRAWIDHLLKK